jgi:hypothetical protein
MPVLTIRFPVGSDMSDVELVHMEAYLHEPQPILASMLVQSRHLLEEDATLQSGPSKEDPARIQAILKLVRSDDIASGSFVALYQHISRDISPQATKIRERFFGIAGSWHPAQSPYILHDQLGLSIVDLQVSNANGAKTFTVIPMRLMMAWSILALAVGYFIVRHYMFG